MKAASAPRRNAGAADWEMTCDSWLIVGVSGEIALSQLSAKDHPTAMKPALCQATATFPHRSHQRFTKRMPTTAPCSRKESPPGIARLTSGTVAWKCARLPQPARRRRERYWSTGRQLARA